MKVHLQTCEKIAFNLGEQPVYPKIIMGAADDMTKRVTKEASIDMTPKLGPQASGYVERILEQLRQGARINPSHLTVGATLYTRL